LRKAHETRDTLAVPVCSHIVLVYLQPFRRNLLLKCDLSRKSPKNH